MQSRHQARLEGKAQHCYEKKWCSEQKQAGKSIQMTKCVTVMGLQLALLSEEEKLGQGLTCLASDNCVIMTCPHVQLTQALAMSQALVQNGPGS